MIGHTILWKLKDEYNTKEIKLAMKKGLEELVGVVPGLVKMEVHIEPLATSNVDVMLNSVLESEQALADYAVHPEHVKVADTLVRPFVAERNVCDFEIK